MAQSNFPLPTYVQPVLPASTLDRHDWHRLYWGRRVEPRWVTSKPAEHAVELHNTPKALFVYHGPAIILMTLVPVTTRPAPRSTGQCPRDR